MKALFGRNRDLALVGCMILILVVLFAPVPPVVLDLAILMNFGLALTILLLTFYVAKPIDFSTFPSLLLIATLFRLALNVATTRLILSQAYAGEVIDAIGHFAVAGNFIVGLVVFLILVIVQFVVVTSGAQRVSEVAARFTLDSMPGQQMSIDADLNMGLIDQEEALRRRDELEREAAFYGSMDGASKFVKGDAIAGVLILLINIIAGWAIGVTQMGMNWSGALQHFTLLTIGDGIAAQLPALIIAVATGIIVTRSSADRELSVEVFRQLFSVPRIPLIVMAMLILLMLLPGMPKWPILLCLVAMMGAWLALRRAAAGKAVDEEEKKEAAASAKPAGPAAIEIALGRELSEAWRGRQTLLLDRIATLRQSHEQTVGIAFPPVSFVDGKALPDHSYEVRFFGTAYGFGEIYPDRVLAVRSREAASPLSGIEAQDPAFGLPAVWVDEAGAKSGRDGGYTVVDAETVLVTHLSELVRTEAGTLLSRSVVLELLEDVRRRQPGLVEELVPNVMSVSDVQRVLQNLLAEAVPVRNVDLIIEYLADIGRHEKDPGELTEQIRQKLSYAICNQLRDRHRDLAVLSLDPRIENQILASVASGGGRGGLGVEPRLAEKLLRQLGTLSGRMHMDGRLPVLLCGPEVRRPIRSLTKRTLPRLAVLSVNEIPMNIDLRSYDIVSLEA